MPKPKYYVFQGRSYTAEALFLLFAPSGIMSKAACQRRLSLMKKKAEQDRQLITDDMILTAIGAKSTPPGAEKPLTQDQPVRQQLNDTGLAAGDSTRDFKAARDVFSLFDDSQAKYEFCVQPIQGECTITITMDGLPANVSLLFLKRLASMLNLVSKDKNPATAQIAQLSVLYGKMPKFEEAFLYAGTDNRNRLEPFSIRINYQRKHTYNVFDEILARLHKINALNT